MPRGAGRRKVSDEYLAKADKLDAESATLFEEAHRIAVKCHEAKLLAGKAAAGSLTLLVVAENAAVFDQATNLKREAERLRAIVALKATIAAPASGILEATPTVTPPPPINPRAAEDALVAEILAAAGAAGKPGRATDAGPAAAIEPTDTTDAEAMAAEIIASAAAVEALS